jgi:DNA-binding transcriptional regulator PaaX
MGELEKTSKKRTQKKQLQNAILATVATAGLLGVAAVAPGALVLLKHAGITSHPRYGESVKRATKTLIEKGLLEWVDGKLRLTEKGKRFHTLTQFTTPQSLSLWRKKKWDAKWRVLIFDIPEQRKKQRQQVRNQLRAIGFVCLQDSVWVYPHPCEEYVALLKAELRMGKELLYLIVDSIEGDEKLRAHFKLARA